MCPRNFLDIILKGNTHNGKYSLFIQDLTFGKGALSEEQTHLKYPERFTFFLLHYDKDSTEFIKNECDMIAIVRKVRGLQSKW